MQNWDVMTGPYLHQFVCVDTGAHPWGQWGWYLAPSILFWLDALLNHLNFIFSILTLEALPKHDKMRHLSKGIQMLLLLVV